MADLHPDEALKKLEFICSRQEICCEDARKKLESWSVAKEEAKKIIDNLLENKFIDESRYCKAYINDKIKYNKWGIRKIKLILRTKNIYNNIIDRSIEEFEENTYIDIIKQEISKKKRTIKETDKIILKQKLIRFCESRGYEYEIYKKLL